MTEYKCFYTNGSLDGVTVRLGRGLTLKILTLPTTNKLLIFIRDFNIFQGGTDRYGMLQDCYNGLFIVSLENSFTKPPFQPVHLNLYFIRKYFFFVLETPHVRSFVRGCPSKFDDDGL